MPEEEKEESDIDKCGDDLMRRLLEKQTEDKDKFVYGCNLNKPPITVKHSELQRYDDSAYRSKCPACSRGILLVRRNDGHPFELCENDYCIACAQHFIYEDIEDMRKNLG